MLINLNKIKELLLISLLNNFVIDKKLKTNYNLKMKKIKNNF